MTYERPVGLTIISVLFWFYGLVSVFFGLFLLLSSGFFGFAGVLLLFVGLLSLLFGVGYCLVAHGLWQMSNTAWWFAVFGLIFSAATFVSILALIYLLLPEARIACGIGEEGRRQKALYGGNDRLGARGAPGAAFCPNPQCRQPLRPHWQFCPHCTTRVGMAAPVGPAQRRY